MQSYKGLPKEEIKKHIKRKIGDKAFCKVERIYESVMRAFGVKKDMPFRVRFAFGLYNRLKKRGRKNVIALENGRYRHNSFVIHGDHNLIRIGEGSTIQNVKFEIYGSYNSIVIGCRALLRNAQIHLGDNGSSMHIGNDTYIGDGFRAGILEGADISIGNDCMFSVNTSLLNSDAHPIIDLATGTRVNNASNIFIGNHVWFGQDVTVLKGAKIGDGTVIGNRSVVTQGNYECNSIYVGMPAHFQRGGVQWLHDRK